MRIENRLFYQIIKQFDERFFFLDKKKGMTISFLF